MCGAKGAKDFAESGDETWPHDVLECKARSLTVTCAAYILSGTEIPKVDRAAVNCRLV